MNEMNWESEGKARDKGKGMEKKTLSLASGSAEFAMSKSS